MHAGFSDELGQQRCRELNHGASCALNDHLPDGAPVITQVLVRRDVDAKFKPFHSGNPSNSITSVFKV